MIVDGFLGLVEKMRIEVYDSQSYTGDPKKTIFVQINPEKYSISKSVSYCDEQPMGSSDSNLSFSGIEGEEVTFEFIFDASGVVPPAKIVDGKPSPNPLGAIASAIKPALANPFASADTVEKELEEFKSLLTGYNGDKHETHYLALLWGGYELKCRLKKMDIEYSIFRRDGRPIRAKATCNFKGTTSYELMKAKENRSSPDMTHERIFKSDSKLTLLSENIYQNNNYYLDVAKANKLLSFRKVRTGRKLFFPPIK